MVLADAFPALERLALFVHMRPPVNYSNLLDGLFVCGMLVNTTASYADIDPNTRSASVLQTDLSFSYIEEDVMFMSEELGVVKYSDALAAHERVLQTLLGDEAFGTMARMNNLPAMTNRILEISQEHERPWLEGLVERRRAERRRAERRRHDGCSREGGAGE